MEHAFWLARWELNQIGFHQHDINAHLKNFWQQLGMAQNATVLVPLCGKSGDMLWLRAEGHPVLGVELSQQAVEAFFAENALVAKIYNEPPYEVYRCDELDILCGDFFKLSPQHILNVAAVYDRASLIALPPAMRKDYVDHLRGILPAGTPILLVTMEYDQDKMKGPPFSVAEDEVMSLYAGFASAACIHCEDIISNEARFRERGILSMLEKVYLITR